MSAPVVVQFKDLAPERLYRLGYEALYNAVNLGRLVGFVGSGVSLVYGNLTWTDFMEEIVKKTDQRLAEAEEMLMPGGSSSSRAQVERVERARHQIALFKRERSEPIVILQFCKQAFALIDEVFVGDSPDRGGAYGKALQEIFAGDGYFVRKTLSERLDWWSPPIRKAAAGASATARLDALDKAVLKAKKSPDKEGRRAFLVLQERISEFYSIDTLKWLATRCDGATRRGLDKLLGSLKEVTGKNAELFQQGHLLPIDRRSISCIFLAASLLKSDGSDWKELVGELARRPGKRLAPPRPLLDPLSDLHQSLRIRRYLTTNYDLELENLFLLDDFRDRERWPRPPEEVDMMMRSRGGSPLSGASAAADGANGGSWLRQRTDGTKVRSDVYDDGASGPLFEFGIGAGDNGVHIFHLHGRVDRPETMIATDSDYNRIYRAEGPGRSGFDLAYDVAIAGNPVLFVGSGLTEDELTRTFRQDVSNARSREDGFVMRPASARADSLAREQMSLRTKFGLYAIHFGHRRRGVGMCLRRHFTMIDMLARKFHLADADSFRPWGKKAQASGFAYVWKDKCPDQAVRKTVLERECPLWNGLAAAKKLSHIGDHAFDDEDDCYAPDLEDVIAIDAMMSRSYGALIRSKKPGEPKPGCFTYEFALVASLDFDGEAVAWLLSKDSESFADKLGREKPGPPEYRARRLIADYLDKLHEKLLTAAIRIELREIGRESSRYRDAQLIPVEARKASLGGQVRHLAAGTGGMGDGRKGWRIHDWDWWRHELEDEEETITLLDEQGREALKPLLLPERSPPAPALFAILGPPGTGKGSFLWSLLSHFETIAARRPRKWLILNCCYGLEADSLISLIGNFVTRDEAGREGPPRPRTTSRREWIESAIGALGRPRTIVLGGIDRLFGIEGEILAAGFDWLLQALMRADNIRLIIVGDGQKCARYFGHRARRTKAGDIRAIERYSVSRHIDRKGPDDGEPDPAPYLDYLDRYWRKQMDEGRRLDLIAGHYEVSAASMASGPLLPSRVVVNALDGLMYSAKGRPWCRNFGALAQEILKTLAFIGLPVEAEVVAIAPAVKRALEQLELPAEERDGIERVKGDKARARPGLRARLETAARARQFTAAVDLLLERGLLQSVEPYRIDDLRNFTQAEDAQKKMMTAEVAPVDGVAFDVAIAHVDPAGKQADFSLTRGQHAIFFRRRLVLHRAVMAYLRERFGVPFSETTLSDGYNLTLYSAQPDDAPAHEPQATAELEELVDQLIDGWKDVNFHAGIDRGLRRLRDRLLGDELLDSERKPGYQADPRTVARLDHWRRLAKAALMRGSLAPASLRAGGGIVRGFFSAVNLFGLDIEDRYGHSTPLGAIRRQKDRLQRILTAAREMQQARGNILTATRELFDTKATFPHRRKGLIRCTYPVFEKKMEKELHERMDGVKSPGVEIKPGKCFWQQRIVPSWAQLPGQLGLMPDGLVRVSGRDEAALRPFYPEEVVWLENERGVIALAQGDLYTAGDAFDLALKANEAIEAEEFQPNRCRILLNQAYLRIERGWITEGRLIARKLVQAFETDLGPAPRTVRPQTREKIRIVALARGYEALCHHLNGLPDLAVRGYEDALGDLNGLREQRAIALFNDRLADLHARYYGDKAVADGYYRRALAAAEAGRHIDVVYGVRVHRALLAAKRDGDERKNIGDSLRLFDAAVTYGTRLDMHRVTVRALSARAELRLWLGDIRAAESDIGRAMALAAKFDMRLRCISLRVLRGRAYEKLDDLANARFLFERALSEAEAINYQRIVEEASDELIRLRPRGN
jgi:tetratricopeptide (TPR) repeat protein